MSVTYDIICVKCKEKLWIGQGYTRDPDNSIYLDNKDVMETFSRFLFVHEKHTLRFVADDYYNWKGKWKDIDGANPKSIKMKIWIYQKGKQPKPGYEK